MLCLHNYITWGCDHAVACCCITWYARVHAPNCYQLVPSWCLELPPSAHPTQVACFHGVPTPAWAFVYDIDHEVGRVTW